MSSVVSHGPAVLLLAEATAYILEEEGFKFEVELQDRKSEIHIFLLKISKIRIL